MQKLVINLSLGLLGLGLVPATFAQIREMDRTKGSVQVAKDVTATRDIMAMHFPEDKTVGVKFRGTHRLPKASGEAKVERKKGVTEIEIELDEMKPAILFGGDYNTYVLWTVSPEGNVKNVGEMILEGNRSKLNGSTTLQTFGMIITAEPHFLVNSPSRFVIVENSRPAGNTSALVRVSEVKYREFEGNYRYDRETLATAPEAKKEVRVELNQARTAVSLAERAKAEMFAREELAKAREALKRAESAVSVGAGRRNVESQARDAIRLAFQAQQLAEERALQAALDAERRTQEEEKARADRRADDEERRRREAEARTRESEQEAQRLAASRAEAEKAAERARMESEKARQETERSRQEADRARLETDRARQEAGQANREREEARNRMREALSLVVETRQTARGIILNLPDILFDTGKATLKPQAREVLSKISGILLVARGYRLVVEGHTDSVGSDELNQRLSDRRAASVRDYLTGSSVSPNIITAKGFGESQPIADNNTTQGRQRNRRVEIIIEETDEFKYRQE